VALSVEGLPPGVSCPPQVLAPNQKLANLVLIAAPDAADWAGEIKVRGTATLNDQTLTREARAATIVWPVPPQQGIPALSRLARSICLAVREKGPFVLDTEVKEAMLPLGGTFSAKIKANRLDANLKAPIQISTVTPPLPLNAQLPPAPQIIATIPAEQSEIEVKLPVPNTVPAGTYTLTFRGVAQMPFAKDPMAKQKPNVAVTEVTPPIRLTVYNHVAEVSVAEPNVSLKPGTEVELPVNLVRKFGYAGEFKLALVLPQGFQGISAQETTIPANANEGKIILKCAGNAAAATNPNIIVRASAVVDKITLNQDARFAVAIVKE
jgi:hypothetical protein